MWLCVDPPHAVCQRMVVWYTGIQVLHRVLCRVPPAACQVHCVRQRRAGRGCGDAGQDPTGVVCPTAHACAVSCLLTAVVPKLLVGGSLSAPWTLVWMQTSTDCASVCPAIDMPDLRLCLLTKA